MNIAYILKLFAARSIQKEGYFSLNEMKKKKLPHQTHSHSVKIIIILIKLG